jgi:hypothetical protein
MTVFPLQASAYLYRSLLDGKLAMGKGDRPNPSLADSAVRKWVKGSDRPKVVIMLGVVWGCWLFGTP